MSLSQAFGYSASGAAPAGAMRPRSTLLASISPVSRQVAVNASQSIRPQEGASGLIQTTQAGLAGKQVEVGIARGGIIADIKKAQAEIIAGVKESGHSVEDVFPNRPMAPSSSAELAFNAASGSLSGHGTLAAAAGAVQSFSEIADILADLKARPEEAQRQVEDILRRASEQTPVKQSFGLIRDANEAPAMRASTIDWNSVLDQYPDALKEIINFDENNYNQDTFPELATLDGAKIAIETQLGTLKAVKNETVKYDAAAVQLSGESFAGMKLPVKPSSADALKTQNAEDIHIKLGRPALLAQTFTKTATVDMAYRA